MTIFQYLLLCPLALLIYFISLINLSSQSHRLDTAGSGAITSMEKSTQNSSLSPPIYRYTYFYYLGIMRVYIMWYK
jgi:hypothetical protein